MNNTRKRKGNFYPEVLAIKTIGVTTSMIIALIAVAHFIPVNGAVITCKLTENTNYDIRVENLCLNTLHAADSACKIPVQYQQRYGWVNHMLRASECEDRKVK